jgi:hypothetical protein
VEWLDAGLDKYDCGFKKATRVATAPPSTRKQTMRPAPWRFARPRKNPAALTLSYSKTFFFIVKKLSFCR